MMEHGDNELLLAAADGDRDAFSDLVERHQCAIIHFVQRFLGFRNISLAEDLAQDVFLSAWRASHSFRGECKVLTWFYRITTNTCLNHQRSARLRRTISLDSENVSDPAAPDRNRPESRTVARECTATVIAAMSDLPSSQRAAVLLRHFDGLCYADIADVLGTTVSSVESLLFRARKSLGEKLSAQGEARPQVMPEGRVENCGVDVSR